jgi:hypothetical protein
LQLQGGAVCQALGQPARASDEGVLLALKDIVAAVAQQQAVPVAGSCLVVSAIRHRRWTRSAG